MAESPVAAFSADAEATAADLIDHASDLARARNISPFEIPEILLLAAVEAAARIDGTAEGTIEWLQNVVDRLSQAETADTPPIDRPS